ncbi:isochorismatase family protein [Rhodococcus sp. IEGM 1366]|uniref:isochorismatase family protein n=1 Tax=Rhodococcus sp. IEGM 1366 TaxID=3082223 RepID=UPI0029531826|nr:isochorismatase family protein [Rhodococcus sp. IEGM 1366]MDV8071350.1 isochorismatase family protein [Rhodococcus sp. IEGM 1366]
MAEYSQHWGDSTESVYKKAGFGSSARRGSRAAIVVVDLTRGFTEPEYPSGSDLTDVVSATASLCASARAARVPVIYTTISYTPAEADGTAIPWLDKATGMRTLREGSEAVEFDPRLTVTDEDHIIVKKGASAFFGTHLASLLVGLGCDTVVVCGATTSGCVRATAVDAVQSGFGVLVPRNCVGDRAAGPHEANLFDIEAKYGDVVDLSEAVAYLESTVAARAR